MSRFALVLHDAGGTVPPMIALGDALVRHGHEVVVLSQPSVKTRAESVGCTFVPLSNVDDYDHRLAIEAQLDTAMRAMLGTVAGDDLLAIDADVAVIDANVTGALAAAEASGRPSAVLLHSLYATYVDTWFGELWPLLADGVNAARSHFDVPAADGWPAVFAAHDRRLAVVPEAFDDHPGQSHFGFLVPPAAGDPPPWPDGDGPTVLVGLSTTYQAQEHLLQTVVDALSDADVRAVVTTGRSVDPGSVRAGRNVAVIESAPHALLLPTTDVVVTHAGLGTVAAALHHGVPLVCTPIDRDQPLNAGRVAELGAGLIATADDVGSAVTRVAADPSFRTAARRLADTSRAEGGAEAAAADLASLAR